MPIRLIVNADDFGLTHGINRAVAELFDAGSLTSATLMASGPAFDDAVSIARQRPGLGVGCHVVLTDGVPVSDPRSIPSLMAQDARSFRPSLTAFLLAVISGRVRQNEITRETIAQIERLQRAGLQVTHLDAHKHTHVVPTVARALFQAAERTGVRAIRNPFEQPWSLNAGQTEPRRTAQLRLVGLLKRRFLNQPQLKSSAVRSTEGTIGVSATGRLDQSTLREMLQALPDGTWELVCHPGYNDRELDAVRTRLRNTREIEYHALLAVLSRKAREESSHSVPHPQPLQLIHYGDIV